MFALVRSFSKNDKRGDVIVNINEIEAIKLVKREEDFLLVMAHMTKDKDGDTTSSITKYDAEIDARASLSHLLADSGMPVDKAVQISKDISLMSAKSTSSGISEAIKSLMETLAKE